jgi:hypothetical protein
MMSSDCKARFSISRHHNLINKHPHPHSNDSRSDYFFAWGSVFLYASSSSFCTLGNTGIWFYTTQPSAKVRRTIESEGTNLVFHAEFTLALRRASQLIRVPKHIIQRDFSQTRELVVSDLRVDDRATAGVEAADHVAYAPQSATSDWEGDKEGTHSGTRAERQPPRS